MHDQGDETERYDEDKQKVSRSRWCKHTDAYVGSLRLARADFLSIKPIEGLCVILIWSTHVELMKRDPSAVPRCALVVVMRLGLRGEKSARCVTRIFSSDICNMHLLDLFMISMKQ